MAIQHSLSIQASKRNSRFHFIVLQCNPPTLRPSIEQPLLQGQSNPHTYQIKAMAICCSYRDLIFSVILLLHNTN